MIGCLKRHNKDKEIVSNYHRNESEGLIQFTSSTSEIILDCHAVGQKSEEHSFYMATTFILPAVKHFLKFIVTQDGL